MPEHARHNLVRRAQMYRYPLVGDGKVVALLEETPLDEKRSKALVRVFPHGLLYQPHRLRKARGHKTGGIACHRSRASHKSLPCSCFDDPKFCGALRLCHDVELNVFDRAWCR